MNREHLFCRALACCVALAAALLFAPSPARALTESQQDAAIASLQSTVASQQTTINALLAKLQYVTASGHDLTLTGNLHVVSGAGHTNSAPNGLGNVIIGYNEARTASGAVNTRTGSHCLIMGQQNNYSSYGGIVAGYGNEASAGYASVTGGRNNTASAQWASITGGLGNAASATYATVGGGTGYAATATYAFLPTSASASSLQSFQTQINTLQTSVTSQGKITNLFALSDGVGTKTELTLTGVNLHLVNGLGATNGEPGDPTDTTNPVVNGLGNLIIGYNGGRDSEDGVDESDVRTGSHNLILGDRQNYYSYGGILAGCDNQAYKPYASITGGTENISNGLASCVTGGLFNQANGDYSSVAGGYGNGAGGAESTVSGGSDNGAGGASASVSGGVENSASGNESSVGGGFQNVAGGAYTSVSGGNMVTDSAEYGWAAGTLHSP